MATFFVRDNRMDRIPALALLAGLVLLPSGSAAQIAVPPLGGVLGRLDTTLTDTIGTLDRTVRNADDLVRARTERLGRFVAGNAAAVEYDARRQPTISASQPTPAIRSWRRARSRGSTSPTRSSPCRTGCR
jgi:hypothetical protein